MSMYCVASEVCMRESRVMIMRIRLPVLFLGLLWGVSVWVGGGVGVRGLLLFLFLHFLLQGMKYVGGWSIFL